MLGEAAMNNTAGGAATGLTGLFQRVPHSSQLLVETWHQFEVQSSSLSHFEVSHCRSKFQVNSAKLQMLQDTKKSRKWPALKRHVLGCGGSHKTVAINQVAKTAKLTPKYQHPQLWAASATEWSPSSIRCRTGWSCFLRRASSAGIQGLWDSVIQSTNKEKIN